MTNTFLLDPFEVLGVGPEASLQEIQAAYRTKAKTYHPDTGGDAWAFRVLARSYELLCTARVMGRASGEGRTPAPQQAPAARQPANTAGEAARESREARAGLRETQYPASRLVAIDMLLIRFELDAPLGLLMASNEDRNLSCTLSLNWPASLDETPKRSEAKQILEALSSIFETTIRQSHSLSQWSQIDDNRFVGWLTYASATQADQAFRMLHASLKQAGLGVFQTIRDLAIPRVGRD